MNSSPPPLVCLAIYGGKKNVLINEEDEIIVLIKSNSLFTLPGRYEHLKVFLMSLSNDLSLMGVG